MPKGKNKAGANSANTDRAKAIAAAAAKIKAGDTTALAKSAIASVQSRMALGASLLAFIGNAKVDSPLYAARYNAGRRSLVLGYLAARFRRDGDNRPDDVLLTYAGECLDAAKVDAASLKDGQRRRTESEERAYGAARVWLSGVVGECGIKPPAASGGGSRQTDEEKAKAKAKAIKEAKANPQAVIAGIKSETAQAAIKSMVAKARAGAKEAIAFAPSTDDAEAFVQSLQRAAVAWLQAFDKVNAKSNGAIPPHISSALTDFKAAVTK